MDYFFFMKYVIYVGEKFLEVGAMLCLFDIYYVCVFCLIIYYEYFIFIFYLPIIFSKMTIVKFVFFLFSFMYFLFLFYFLYLFFFMCVFDLGFFCFTTENF